MVILVFLVQTIREAWNLRDEYIPVSAVAVSLVMFLGAYSLSEGLVEAIATALMVAAAGSFTVRYVKNGTTDGNTTRSTTVRVQGDDLAPTRISREERETI